MVAQHYRWDFIGLSTDTKPTPQTSEKVVDGSTFYCSDNSKLYVFYKDTWYEKTATGGGGTSINVVQTTGSSTEDVMSQKAVTDAIPTVEQGLGNSTTKTLSQNAIGNMLFNDNYAGGGNKVQLGNTASTKGQQGVAVGSGATVSSAGIAGVALGGSCQVTAQNAVAFAQGQATTQGEFNVGTGYNWSSGGYDGTAYRVIRDVHDGVLAHDAVTVGQINALIDAINTATGATISHIGS